MLHQLIQESTALSAILTEGTINRLKSMGIGIMQNNIVLTSTLIENLSENNVSPIPAVALFYEFNLNKFTMIMQFTKLVALEFINIFIGFVLQSGMSAGDTIT